MLVQWAVSRWGLRGGLCVPMVLAVMTGTWVWVLPETRGIVLPSLTTTTAVEKEKEEEKGDVEEAKELPYAD